MTQIRDSISLAVKRSQVSVTLKINSEKEYEIVKLSNINKDKLSEN